MKIKATLRPMAGREPGLRSRVLGIAWPASVEFLIITSIVFADIIFLARMGTEVIAGVGIAVTVYRVFYEVFNSVAVASTTVVAQAVGAGNTDLARRGAAQSVLLAVTLGVISGAVGALVASYAMSLMGTEGFVKQHGVVYMRIHLLASPLYAIAIAGGGVLKGVGDTKTPMVLTLVSSALKVGLSWGLIFGRLGLPALGVTGAALATVVAYGLNAVMISAKLYAGFDGIRLRIGEFVPDWELLKRISALTYPVAVERMVMRMGFVFYMRVVSALGTVVLAANQIALRLESVSLTVGFGFTIAATTLVGQAVGRRDIKGAVASVRATMEFSVLVMTSMTVILILVRKWAVGIFMPAAGVEELALACLVIGALEMPALGLVFTYGGALRGAGDTRSPMLVALVGTFLLRLPLVYLFGIRFGIGLKGIWYGTLLDWIGRAILIYLIFVRGGWKDKGFVEEKEVAGPVRR
jgi:putative MATE family efflux protein